ncbi:hypothetical protein AHAS_Ahas19G0364800 [Arachis hypogaea]
MRDREDERGGYTRGGGSRGVYPRLKDPQVWTKEEYHRLENDSFIVFMDNLPEDISRRELYQLFCWTGRINDIYLCRKQKNAMAYLFAFVRYTTKGGALKAIAEMNHFRLRGKTISVGEAKFRRNVQAEAKQVMVDTRQKLERRPERIIMENGAAKNPGKGEVMAGVPIHVHQATGSTKRVEMVIHTNMPYVEYVREIGEQKILFTFDTVQHVVEAYTFKLDAMLQVFHRIRRWEESERGGSRRVWLECYGMPLHVWSAETFKAIGGLWGDVLHCDIPTGTGASFRVGRFQVDTCEFNEIREWVRLAIGEKEIAVFVKEMGWEASGTGNLVEQKQVYKGGVVDESCDLGRREAELAWDPAADLIIGTEQGGPGEG